MLGIIILNNKMHALSIPSYIFFLKISLYLSWLPDCDPTFLLPMLHRHNDLNPQASAETSPSSPSYFLSGIFSQGQ